MKNKLLYLVTLFIAFGIVFSTYWLFTPFMEMVEFYTWTHKNVDNTVLEGNQIIFALEKYQSETGAYPEKLELLVPKYILQIPKPCVPSYEWYYSHYFENGIDSYTLSVSLDNLGYPSCSYETRNGEWHRQGVVW